jgi:hypothetical protein
VRYAQARQQRAFDKLYVVAVISNPCRYKARYDLYHKFEQHVLDHGAELLTVEMAFGERPWVVTEANNPSHIRLRSAHELWHKENMVNIGIRHLPQGWNYVAWVDADITFARPDWVEETIHQLQHYPIVQMFSEAVDMSPTFDVLSQHQGFIHAYMNGQMTTDRSYEVYHPGFAWAARRDAINTLGGLFDTAILGAGDRHMAVALVSDVRRSYPSGVSTGYMEALRVWQDRALQLRRNVGYVPGAIFHHWHGKKVDRRYRERWQILIKHGYDPEFDIKPDWQGLWQLSDNKPDMRDDIRAYFRQRNEDSIDVE